MPISNRWRLKRRHYEVVFKSSKLFFGIFFPLAAFSAVAFQFYAPIVGGYIPLIRRLGKCHFVPSQVSGPGRIVG